MRAIAVSLALGLVASTALATNTGFKLNYEIRAIGKTSNNLISLPYFYYPTGVAGQTGNAVDLCRALNDGAPGAPKVVQILRFMTDVDIFKAQSCTNTAVSFFDVKPGEAYVVKPSMGAQQLITIIGAHDDEYAYNKLNTKFVHLRAGGKTVGSSRVDLQACKLEYSIVSPK